jgi:hypothetical protein
MSDVQMDVNVRGGRRGEPMDVIGDGHELGRIGDFNALRRMGLVSEGTPLVHRAERDKVDVKFGPVVDHLRGFDDGFASKHSYRERLTNFSIKKWISAPKWSSRVKRLLDRIRKTRK